MKVLLTVLAFALVAPSVHAQSSVGGYVKHSRLKGETRKNGKFNVDYVQLIARAGKPLSANDLKINKAMAKAARESLCDGGSVGGMTSEVNITTDVTFVSDRLLGLSQGYDITCAGAAHPSFGSSATLYDRASGTEIDIRTGKEPSYDEESEDANLKAINAVILGELKKQAALDKAERGDDDCDSSYESISFYASDITLTSKALKVQSSEAHVSMACQINVSIPLAKFEGVATGLLAELVAGARK